jgi:arylsulfatase A-like enzyme
LPKNARTIAHALRERGYTTAFFGKWHLGERDRAAALVGEAHARTLVSPEARGGFETWEGFEGGFLLNDPWLHGSRLSEPEQFRGYQSDVVCERAARWITEQAEAARRAAPKPWFAVVSLEPPHPPYDAPAAGVAVRDPRAIALPGNVPRGGEVEARARRELAGYYAHIEATDRAIGTWLLPRAGAEAMVIFTSAHGDMHGAHGHFRKGWPHEESVRVPLLVRGASASGAAARGETRDVSVSLLDLPELMLAAADGREPRPPAEVARISMPSVVALPQQCDRVWRGVRNRARKLVLGPDDAPWLYFDLEADPLEQRNLAAEPSRRGEIAAWRKLV